MLNIARFVSPALFWLALIFAYFAPALSQGLVLAPGDVMAQDLPQRAIAAQALRQGEVPFWNPYNFSGLPLLATIHVGVFFPGNAAFLALSPAMALNVTMILAFWVAGGATYLFARALGLPRLASAFSGIAFAFGGFMMAHVSNLQMVQAAGLLPLMLWAAERYARTLEVRFALTGCGIVALQLLAGHPQIMAYSLLVAGAYTLWRSFGLAKGERLRYVATQGLMVGFGIGLCLFQLLPTLDLIRMTPRDAFSYNLLISHSVPPRYLPTLLAPFLYGGAPSAFMPTPYWGLGTWMQGYYGYVGLATLLMGLIALGSWRLDGRVRFWGVMAALGLVLALGGFTPVYRVWALLPILNTMPAPDRHFLEFNLALAMLGGIGFARLQREAPAGWYRAALGAVAGVGLLVLSLPMLVWVAGPAFAARTQPFVPAAIDLAQALRPSQPNFWLPAALWLLTAIVLLAWRARTQRWLAPALVAVQLVDLAIFGYHYGWWQFSPRLDQVVVQAGLRFSDDRSLSLPRVRYPFFGNMETLRTLGHPGISFLDGARSVNGYDAFIYSRYAHYTGMTSLGYLSAAHVWEPGHHALNVLGLKTLRLDPAIADQPDWRERLRGERWSALPAPAGVLSFDNGQALPRAWRPGLVSTLAPEQVDARMTNDVTFDPSLEALVETPLAGPVSAGTAAAHTVSLNRIRVETDGKGAGLVVVNESYDPGWRAFSGERELAVRRVDGLVLGVDVPPGQHSIMLRYEPRLWRLGLLGSGLSLVGLLLWVRWVRGRTRAQNEPSAGRRLEHDHAA